MPLIVEMCTSIVEARGLEVVGIYRVPGNTAAISHLTDSVNKGFENINLQVKILHRHAERLFYYYITDYSVYLAASRILDGAM